MDRVSKLLIVLMLSGFALLYDQAKEPPEPEPDFWTFKFDSPKKPKLVIWYQDGKPSPAFSFYTKHGHLLSFYGDGRVEFSPRMHYQPEEAARRFMRYLAEHWGNVLDEICATKKRANS